jgi:hypothetical protein
MNGWGTKGVTPAVGLAFRSRDLTASYVVKKAPAMLRSDLVEILQEDHVQDGIVIKTTLPIP